MNPITYNKYTKLNLLFCRKEHPSRTRKVPTT